jgi:hypothetical protein
MKKVVISLFFISLLSPNPLICYFRTSAILINPTLSTTIELYGDNHNANTDALQKREQLQYQALTQAIQRYDHKKSTLLVLAEDDATTNDAADNHAAKHRCPLLYGLSKRLSTINPSSVTCQAISNNSILHWALDFFDYHFIPSALPAYLQSEQPAYLATFQQLQYLTIDDLYQAIESQYQSLWNRFYAYKNQHNISDEALRSLDSFFQNTQDAYSKLIELFKQYDWKNDNKTLLQTPLLSYASQQYVTDTKSCISTDKEQYNLNKLLQETEAFCLGLRHHDYTAISTTSEHIYRLWESNKSLQQTDCFKGLHLYRIMLQLRTINDSLFELEASYQILTHQDDVKKMVVIAGAYHIERLYFLLRQLDYTEKESLFRYNGHDIDPQELLAQISQL